MREPAHGLPVTVGADGLPPAPPYGHGTLSEVLPSLLAGLGVPGEEDRLGLAAGSRVCLLLVDGMGLTLLRRHAHLAPFLAGLAGLVPSTPGDRATGFVSAGFPSTTATSLGSIGTGLTPAVHGILGYQVAIPDTGRLFNALRWPSDVDPLSWQPHRTAFERAAEAGVRVSHVARSSFAGSGLTRAALRGPDFLGADAAGERVADAVASLSGAGPTLAFVYHGDLDSTGHRRGVDSDAWREELAHTDQLVERLHAALPDGTTLVVTADHGMVDVPDDCRVDADTVDALRAGVRLLGGEPRARYVYTRPGASEDVAAAWREILGSDFWVLDREEVLAAGWFGAPTETAAAARVGEVVAAARGRAAVVATRDEPTVSRLVGMHGSLTEEEMLVPLLTARV
ncbi:MAG: alkaline phosphatase family protein [Actinomycetes bacterium]